VANVDRVERDAHPERTGVSTAALALGISTVRSTVTFKDYSGSVSGRPLLSWVLEWLNGQNPNLRVAITCAASEATAVRDIVGLATPVIVHDELTPVERLEAAAAACNATEIIAARLQVLLGPASQIKAVQEALGSGYGSVLVHVLPEGAAVEGYTLDVLRALKSHVLSGLPQTPRDLLNILCAAASAAGDINPFSWRHAGLDGRKLYESAIDRPLPERIDLETSQQVVRIAAILSSGLPRGDGLALLRQWQDGEVHDELAELALGRTGWVRNGMATAGAASSVALRARQRHILYVSVASAFSGAEEVACLLAEHLDKEQFTPYALVSHEGLFTERLRHAGVSVICPGHDIGQGSLARIASTARIVAVVRPDLIHAHGHAGLGVLMAAVNHDIPLVQHIHVRKLDSILREQCLAADQVIAVSRYVRERVMWAGVPDDRISVIYNGVRTPAPDSTENRAVIRQRYGIPDDAEVLLMVGRYAERKRHDVFVRALSLVAAKGRRVYGVCAGDPLSGPDVYRRMLQLSRECGVGDRIIAPGFLP